MPNLSEIMELQKLAGMENFKKLTIPQCLEREKLIELLKSGGVRDFPFNAALADRLIANDVVSVVRCKDCKDSFDRANGTRYCRRTGRYVSNTDFCSYGERRI